eukprot:364522-Chlamydomonas_euryale.AAC.17
MERRVAGVSWSASSRLHIGQASSNVHTGRRAAGFTQAAEQPVSHMLASSCVHTGWRAAVFTQAGEQPACHGGASSPLHMMVEPVSSMMVEPGLLGGEADAWKSGSESLDVCAERGGG